MSHSQPDQPQKPRAETLSPSPEEKRRLIDRLEEEREARGVTPATPDPSDREAAVARLQAVVATDADLRACLETVLREPAPAQARALRGARAEARMLEETVQSFENKLLEAIGDAGELHQRLDETKAELFEARSRVASLTRQRGELRERIEELRAQGQMHLRALAAAERELLFLNSRFETASHTPHA
jgi:uncharacterized coiled-coil DUF342 family protein